MTVKMWRRNAACSGVAALGLVGRRLLAVRSSRCSAATAHPASLPVDYQRCCASVPNAAGSAGAPMPGAEPGIVSAALPAGARGQSSAAGSATPERRPPACAGMRWGRPATATCANRRAMKSDPRRRVRRGPPSAGAQRITMREDLMLTPRSNAALTPPVLPARCNLGGGARSSASKRRHVTHAPVVPAGADWTQAENALHSAAPRVEPPPTPPLLGRAAPPFS